MTARWQNERAVGDLALTTVDGDAARDQHSEHGRAHQGTSAHGRPALGTPAQGTGGTVSDRRVSPDPMQSTDKYRLVTPFTLHL